MAPSFRAFDSFIGFYSGGKDDFTYVAGSAYDFRRDMAPNCGPNCSQVAWQDQGMYSTAMLAQEAVCVVGTHDTPQ
eukprot:g4313.t1